MSERVDAEKYLRMRWAAERAERSRLQAVIAAEESARAEAEADRLRAELIAAHDLGPADHIDADTLVITRAPREAV